MVVLAGLERTPNQQYLGHKSVVETLDHAVPFHKLETQETSFNIVCLEEHTSAISAGQHIKG